MGFVCARVKWCKPWRPAGMVQAVARPGAGAPAALEGRPGAGAPAAWRHEQQRRFGRKRVRKTRDGQGRQPARRKQASCLHARARYTPATCTTLIHHIIGCRVCSVAHLSKLIRELGYDEFTIPYLVQHPLLGD